jgi:hypothetical protein
MAWYTRACPVCTGDMHDDEDDIGWVKCFLCARTFQLVKVNGVKQLISTHTLSEATIGSNEEE